jgi:DGQHR domain-containing protein
MTSNRTIRVNALRVKQRPDVPVYVFGIEGRLVYQLASVSYAQRTKDGVLTGYQRGAVQRHIGDILSYLGEGGAILPNAIVVAFDSRVSFEALKGTQPSEWGTFGHLSIPLMSNGSQTKAGWIVDGQQRATALAKLDPKRSFPVVVVAFQSDSQELQREQFLLVNRTKPLPRDLLNEILPEVRVSLPKNLEKQRVAARVLASLRFDAASPFAGRVRGLGGGGDRANISQSALLAVIQDSIKKKGVLFDYYDSAEQKHDIAGMARALNVFFEGVARTWPDAWSADPKASRLVHGVGIVALGHLMDRVLPDIDLHSQRAASVVENRLSRIRSRCAWMSGRWPTLGCAWNELQNTSQDKARLTDYLLKEYISRSS